jgi:phosphoglycerate dehydrogenase-like enzyme
MPTLAINAVSSQSFWQLPRGFAERVGGALGADWRVEVCSDTAALPAHVRRSRAVMGWPFPAALARGATELRWVHFFTAGVPESWRAESLRPIQVTSASGVSAESVAEHGLFLALAALRGLGRSSLLRWDPEGFAVARSPRSSTAGIVGYGPVGQRLAELLAPLFGSLQVLTRTPRPEAPLPVFTWDDADAFFARAHFLFLAVPLTDSTRELLGSPRFFAALRPDVCLVNLARGELLGERALLQFLEAHPDSRYLSDVAHPEPYGEGLALWSCPRVLLTPHVAARRDDAWERITAQVLELVRGWDPS